MKPDESDAASRAESGAAAPEAARGDRRRLRLAIVGAAAALVALVALLGWYVDAQAARAANASLPLSQRAAAARRVAQLRPWSGEADVAYALLESERLMQDPANWDAAEKLLYEAYLRNIGNRPLRARLTEIHKDIMLRDAGKAHKQHGHEGPKGELGPEDIER